MNPRELGALSRMLQHIPRERVVRRATLVAKRRARSLVERLAPGRVRPVIDAAPRAQERWPQPTLSQIGDDTRSDADFVAQARLWIDRHPIYEPNYWVEDWEGTAVSDRLMAWMHALGQRDLSGEEIAPIHASMVEQLAFLARNLQTDLGGFALLRNLTALRWGAACFEGPAAESWAQLSDRHLGPALDQQLAADGSHISGVPSVHLEVFATLLELHDVLPEGALQERLAVGLSGLAYAAAFMTNVDDKPFLLGQSSLSPSRTAASLLDTWRAAGGSVDAVPPVAALADAGLYVYRTTDDLVLVDAGPIGDPVRPAEAHADALAFTWSVGGRRIIVDAGWAPAEDPAAQRATLAHNSITLDDQSQAEILSGGRVGRRWQVQKHAWMPREHGFVLTASHDGFAHMNGSPVHRRTVEVSGRKIRVEDRIEGGDGQRVVARLLLHPEVQVRVLGSGAILTVDDLEIDLRTTAAVRSIPAQWHPEPGASHPTARLELDLGTAPCTARFTLQVRQD